MPRLPKPASEVPTPEAVEAWEAETRRVIADLKCDQERAEQRRVAYMRQVAELDNQIAVLTATIERRRQPRTEVE